MKRIKKWLSFFFRFFPLIILIAILIYLGFVNSVSEVYIDLVSTKISFVTAEKTDELLSNIPVDSVQLFNCDLKVKLREISQTGNVQPIFKPGVLNITRNDESVDSQIDLSTQNRLLLKNLSVPIFSRIQIIREENTIRFDLLTESNVFEKCGGLINTGGMFLVSGRNIKLSALNQYSDYDILYITTARFSKNVRFEANDETSTIILYVPSDKINISEIIKNLNIKNISFVDTDYSKRKNREKSTILSGKIQVFGIDFFGKRFLLKEEKLDESEFLNIADSDEYFISSVSLVDQGFQISISSEEATELEKGKHIRLLRSIFPSILDFIVAEPSKKTFWAILIFVLTQFSLLRKTLKTHLIKGKSTR